MKRRMVCGVGFDSKGKYKSSDGSKPTKIYSVWRGMIERCYNPKQLARRPTYIGCTVHPDWHDYQVFAEWYDNYKYKGKGYEMDKDILVKGNKLYSPETVCLVPRDVNALFPNAKKARGKYPQGVNYYEPLNSYCSRVRINNKLKHLGYYGTPNEAYEVYKKEKERHVKDMANLWFGNIEPRVYEALMDWELES